MSSLVRKAALAALLVTCSLCPCACARSAVGARVPLSGFTTQEQRILACLDLQDHIVDLFADDYVSREGVALSARQRVAFRDGWAEQLAKGGTFEGFDQACFGSLTARRYDCGMSSRTAGGVEACLRLSER